MAQRGICFNATNEPSTKRVGVVGGLEWNGWARGCGQGRLDDVECR